MSVSALRERNNLYKHSARSWRRISSSDLRSTCSKVYRPVQIQSVFHQPEAPVHFRMQCCEALIYVLKTGQHQHALSLEFFLHPHHRSLNSILYTVGGLPRLCSANQTGMWFLINSMSCCVRVMAVDVYADYRQFT